jgi:hypothetical protein
MLLVPEFKHSLARTYSQIIYGPEHAPQINNTQNAPLEARGSTWDINYGHGSCETSAVFKIENFDLILIKLKVLLYVSNASPICSDLELYLQKENFETVLLFKNMNLGSMLKKQTQT